MLSLDDNFHAYSLPPFANEVNKKLSQEIREKEVALSNITATLEDNVSRAEAMEAHKKNVQQELLHTQALYDARTRQIETETHFKQLAERESGRLAQEIKRIEKEMADITDHLNTVQNNIYAGNERIETLRTTLKLSKQELASWLQIQSEKEEDSLTILKYAAADDARIRSLNLQIEKLLTQVNKKKNLLSAEVTETQVAQIELDKTTEEFKRLHASRLELIQKWEEAVKEMKERDKEIEQAREREREIKEEMKRLRKVIEEKQAFLEQQLATNAETEKKIGICDRNVGKYRMEQTEANVSLSQFQDELEVLRNTLNKTATDLVNKRAEIVNMKSDLSERQQRLEKENAHRMETKNRLMLLTDETVSMEAKAQELQNILKQEEFRSKELERELKILREQQFKRNQELFKLKQDEKNLLAEQAGGEAALKNLKSRINKLDQETQKQQALLYTQEFQIQQLERKVRRAQGDRTDEEKEVLMQKIEALNNQLEEQTRKWNLLNGQLKKSQDDLRHAKRRLEVLQKERATVIENIDELNLYNESAANQLAAKTKEKEELMVEENILKLELRKLRGFLNVRADEVFSLETRQVQLQLALEERSKEIEIHKDMLRLQIKNAEEERSSAHAELRERVSKVEKMKRRYEILMTQFTCPMDDSPSALPPPAMGGKGEGGLFWPSAGGGSKLDEEEHFVEHTQAYYVIRAAQQREELQREGDELDAKIRKAEKEIKALENTLRHMNDRNEEFRMFLYKAELNSKDLQHKEMLEQQYRTAMERYKAKRLELTDMQQDLLNLEKSLSIAQGDETSRLQAVQILESKLAALAREIEQQEAKRERAIRWAQKHAKELRRSIHGLNALAGAVGAGGTGQQQGQGQAPGTGAGRGELTDEEIDIKTRELKERASTAIVELNKLSETHPELYEMLQGLFQKYHIQPPSRAVSRVASRAGSIRDDLSETSSVLSGGANNMRRSLMGHSSSRATPRMSMVSPVLGLQGADAMNRSESRASSEGGRGGEKRVSTTDLNATITLPPATNFSRSNSQRNLVASHPPPLPRSSSNSSSRSSSVNGTPAPGATAPLDFVLTGKNADPASSLNRSTGGKSGKKQQQQFQPITGANRVKTPARPGSAGSVSSRGSAASLKSERSGFGM